MVRVQELSVAVRAVRRGQLADLDTPPLRMLADDEDLDDTHPPPPRHPLHITRE